MTGNDKAVVKARMPVKAVRHTTPDAAMVS